MYKKFKLFALMFLLAVLALSVIQLAGLIDINTDLFAVVTTILVALATIFQIFAEKPLGKEDVSVAVDKVLLSYETDTFQSLKQAKEEEKNIREFIEWKSNEIFLIKLRAYLENEIIRKYKGSELEQLVDELQRIENQLAGIDISYTEIDLPSRLKRLLHQLEKDEQLQLYYDLIDALPLPWIFPKNLIKVWAKFWHERIRPQFIKDNETQQAKREDV